MPTIKKGISREFRHQSMFSRRRPLPEKHGLEKKVENWSEYESELRLTVLKWALRSAASDRRLFERLRELFPAGRLPDCRIMFLRKLVDTVAEEFGGREAVFEAISNGDRWLSDDPGES
jgi:hypothetical protein